MRYSPFRKQKASGFTLIEIIVGIVAFFIALSIVSQLIAPTEQQSADQIHQIKAAELGQALMDEILGRAFDENSDMVGGRDRCGETGQPACTPEGSFGPDTGEGNRALFDDVDDYISSDFPLTNSTNTSLHSGYDSFKVSVEVEYDGATLGLVDELAKRIKITVTTPLGTDIEFAAYKANF